MPFTITVHHGADYLLVKATGPALLADLYGFMDVVATIATNMGNRRAVMDLQEVEIGLSFTEHLNLGVYASERLRQLGRVASVVSQANRTGTSEKAAQQMGLQLRTFTSLDEGLAWIAE
jgi:hypothetical protein